MKKRVFLLGKPKKLKFWGLGEFWVRGWNQGRKKRGLGQFGQPPVGGNSVIFSVLFGV